MWNYFSVRDGRIVSLAVIRNTPSPVLTSAGNTAESAMTPWEPSVLRPYPGVLRPYPATGTQGAS